MFQDFSESPFNQKVKLEYNLIKKDIQELVKNNIKPDDLSEKKKRLIERVGMERPLLELKIYFNKNQ